MKHGLQSSNSKNQVASNAKSFVVSDKSVRVLASAIYRQLQDEGCEARHIVSVSAQLIDLVTSALQKDDPNTSM